MYGPHAGLFYNAYAHVVKVTDILYSGKIWGALILTNFKFGKTNVYAMRDNATLNIGEVLIWQFPANSPFRQIKTLAKFSHYMVGCTLWLMARDPVALAFPALKNTELVKSIQKLEFVEMWDLLPDSAALADKRELPVLTS